MNDEQTIEQEVKPEATKPEEIKPFNIEYDTPPKEFVPGTKVPEGKDGKEPDPFEMSDAEYVQYCYENRMPFWAIKKSVLERYPPEISSLEPSTAAIGDESFQLKVSGTKFFADSVIVFAGVDEPTTLNPDGTLSTGVNMGVWHGADVIPVQVRNGGNISNTLEFTFTATAGKGAAGQPPDPDQAEELDEPDEEHEEHDDNGKRTVKRKAKHKK